MRVAIAGGGTAGHVHPGLALARALRGRGHQVEFIGTDTGLEARLVPAAGFDFRAAPARPFVRKLSPAALAGPLVALRAVRACREMIRGADAVVGMGGYASVPAVLAATRERVPVVLHEQNAIPGLANRVLARPARRVALSFADARRFFGRRVPVVVTGNPVREEILRVIDERDRFRKEAAADLDLDPDRRTVVVFGGSQGALHLDRAAAGACRVLADRADLQMLLITGPAHLEAIRRGLPDEPDGLRVRTVGYLERMELAYAIADLLIARAGATSIAELTVCGLPALLVPYPYATRGHQEANARSLQRAGGASVMLDDQVSAESLAERVRSLVDHEERLGAMAQRSAAFGRPDAADRLADVIEEVAGGGT